MQLLMELHQGGATIVMVTHDDRFVRNADRTVRLFDGRIVEERAAPPSSAWPDARAFRRKNPLHQSGVRVSAFFRVRSKIERAEDRTLHLFRKPHGFRYAIAHASARGTARATFSPRPELAGADSPFPPSGPPLPTRNRRKYFASAERFGVIRGHIMLNAAPLKTFDPDVYAAVSSELARQQNHIELIASENFTYPAVMEAQASVLTNKYAEGYPGKRWYGGCEQVDKVEILAIERAKKLFGAEHANVQPHSGSQANFAVYTAVLSPGDKILGMNLSHGGHLTHGNPANFSGKLYHFVQYGVREDTGLIDYEELAAIALREKPKMITVGASAYSRIIDFARMGEIARGVGAFLFADIAHIAGLVASGHHPSPFPHADFVTTTTHKTLRGPRGGLTMCKAAHAKAIDSAVFPGGQGGPLMHVIAAKAVCFGECLKPEFKDYSARIIANAHALAAAMTRHGYKINSGGTDNHLMLVDLRAKFPELTGKVAQETLDLANITCNKNTVPFETRSPFQASGIRLGTPAVTTRGMNEADMAAIAACIDTVLAAIGTPGQAGAIAQVKQQVLALTARYPLPYRL